jgi:hypothetical protein
MVANGNLVTVLEEAVFAYITALSRHWREIEQNSDSRFSGKDTNLEPRE